MAETKRRDRAWLLSVARQVAKLLKHRSPGSKIHVRRPSSATVSNTDGWFVSVGALGVGQPRLQLWFDRFSGYESRKLYACLVAEKKGPILAISRRTSRELQPVRRVFLKDTQDDRYLVLRERLRHAEFGLPVLEIYETGRTFLGMFDWTRDSRLTTSRPFVNRAVTFFEDMARAVPRSYLAEQVSEVFPAVENRKKVVSHLRRERSSYLASARKAKDDYECQVCGLRFEDTYGIIGRGYAEAHHLVPLSQLRGAVRTVVGDLRTVCSNCHRMLHKMTGKREDIASLRHLVRARRQVDRPWPL